MNRDRLVTLFCAGALAAVVLLGLLKAPDVTYCSPFVGISVATATPAPTEAGP